MAKKTAASIQADIAKGAFRPHTALSNMALAYFQSDAKAFAKTIFPICPVTLSSDNYYDLTRRICFGTIGRGNPPMERLIRRYCLNTQRVMPAW